MTAPKKTILVVDDVPGNLDILADILSPDYTVMVAKSGRKALEIAQTHPDLDLILLDVVMPDLDGFITCCLLKSDARTKEIPVIFVSTQTEAFDVARGLEVGGVDYLTKPVNRMIVRARVKAHLALSSTTRMLTHELGVHQVELELQNEELRRAYKELEESRAKYLDLYECAPVGNFTLTENGQILEANHTAVQLLGIERAELMNNPLSRYVASEFRDGFYLHCRNVIKSGTQQACQLKLLKKKGTPFFVHLESMPVRNAYKTITQIRISVIDIHDKKPEADALKESGIQSALLLNLLLHPAMFFDESQKKIAGSRWAQMKGTQSIPAQDSLIAQAPLDSKFFEEIFSLTDGDQNQQRLVTIIEDSNDAITVLDLHGNIKAWNQRAEKIYGFSSSEALKMTVLDLVPSKLKKETLTMLKDIKSGVLTHPFETRRIAKDGRPLDIQLTVTSLMKNKKIVAIATTERDITEFNRRLASIKEFPKRLILAQEKERSRISQEIHSDFGQSLMALKMFISMSASELKENSLQVKQAFEEAKKQLGHIIDKARELSHELAPPSLQYIGLVEAIKKLAESSRYDKNLKIHLFHRNMYGVTFESKDIIIFRIVQEAINNIFKHARATEAWIKILCQNSVFTLEISDNGKGFDPENLSKSRGLGLDLMKEQALLIQGDLSMKSQIGKGTTLKITLPFNEKNRKE